jgi:hypothetical protein
MPSGRNLKDSNEDEPDVAPGEGEDEQEASPAEDEGIVEKTSRGVGRGERRSQVRAGGRTPWQQFKAQFRDARLWVYTTFFIAALLVAVFGVFSIWMKRALGPWFEARFNELGPWNTWLFILGLIAILAASYLYLTLLYKKREFHRLISTKSKGDFVHSLDRIERLAFELGTHENEIVVARKREFKIRH